MRDNLEDFHGRQLPSAFEINRGKSFLGEIFRPLKRVGVYAPGGTAAYPSTVMMCVVPAKIAGVKDIELVSPPKGGKVNPDILAAAFVAGASELTLVGGAQAIAALACGTESVKKVDKIVGPGNAYVASAKKQVFGLVDVDSIAGPSEILIIADGYACPEYIAADLLSQAEHDRRASAILITTSENLAKKVIIEVEARLKNLPRAEIALSSLENYGGIILAESLEKAAELSDSFAPEHLEILTAEPEKVFKLTKNAGTVFLGEYSPEPLGDYLAGVNHVLPTGGTARFFSPLSVRSFMKSTQYVKFDENGLKGAAEDIIYLANREGLAAHAEAVKARNI